MGYYIQVPNHKGKAQQLVNLHGGQIIPKPNFFSDIPENRALIVVVDNGLFEAAAYAYSEGEFAEFTDPTDGRPKKYVLLDKGLARELTGFNR